MPDNEKIAAAISNAINKLADTDFHIGAEARKVCFGVISDLRNVKMDDEDIETLLQQVTGLRPNRIREYMRQEESNADKFANLVSKYGLPQRKRITPALPKQPDEQLTDNNGRSDSE